MKNILSTLKSKLTALAGDRRGQTMVEYALLAGFLAAAGGAILSTSGNNVKTVYSNVGETLQALASDAGIPTAASPLPSDSPAPADNPSGPGDDGGSGGDEGGKDKKEKKDKSNNSDNDNGNGNKNGHNK